MPGSNLSFICPCGFQSHDIKAGATETGEYTVFLCLQCKRISSIWTSTKHPFKRACNKCGMWLITVTDSGAWEPASLQLRYPDSEPWMIENEIDEDELPEDESNNRIRDIRLLCPICGKYSLKYEITVFWD